MECKANPESAINKRGESAPATSPSAAWWANKRPRTEVESEPEPNTPGSRGTGIIYALTCPEGKTYVGKTTRSMSARVREHEQATSGCRLIRDALVRHGGIRVFDMRVLLCCPADALDSNESIWIEKMDCVHPRGYNLRCGATAGSEVDSASTSMVPYAGREEFSPEEEAAAVFIITAAVGEEIANAPLSESEEEVDWQTRCSDKSIECAALKLQNDTLQLENRRLRDKLKLTAEEILDAMGDVMELHKKLRLLTEQA